MLDLANGDPEQISASIVCEAATKGDLIARQIIDRTVEYLSIGIINLILILNPQIIVLGGDICRLPGLEEQFIEPIRRNASRIVPFEMPRITATSLGEDAGILGATFLAIESLLLSHFPYKLSQAPIDQDGHRSVIW